MSRQFAGSSVDPVTDAEAWASAVDAAERLIRRQSPTADAAANRKTSRREWPPDIDFSRITFSLERVEVPNTSSALAPAGRLPLFKSYNRNLSSVIGRSRTRFPVAW